MANICTQTDSYKGTHWKQYPKGTQFVYSYLESRGGKFDNTVFYGLQYILKKYFVGQQVTESKIQMAKKFWDAHIGPGLFNEVGWRHILEKHNGYLPIKIKAVPEGTPVSTHNVLATVENTDPEVPWLTNFIETMLLQVWYPITVATLSREIKKILIKYLKKTTSYSSEEINNIVRFQLHDFGFRGTGSFESAGIGGSAHLVNFFGTDTVAAIEAIQEFYNTDEMVGFSIPASEHSTITSWGQENESKAFENMLTSYPTGLVACVSDSFNILNACDKIWGQELKDLIVNREGRLVIRPDSGDPVQTLKRVFGILWERFGGVVNEKGFKVLHPNVRVIQGDGVNIESIVEILDMMVEQGFSAENIAFGMGGALLQKVDRDTQKFAFKCSSITIDGTEKDVMKNPMEIDENGNQVESFKKSKSGKMILRKKSLKETSEEHFTEEHSDPNSPDDIMVTVFENGVMIKEWEFGEIRQRAEVHI